MTSYSHSRLGTFQQCRYKYKLQYIDKVKVEVPTTIEAFMGALVHNALEKLYKDLQYQKVNTKEELISFFESEWGKTWDDNILIAKKEYTKENYKEMGIKFIADYYDHYKPFNHWKTIGLETEDRLNLENGNQYHIRIDRLACDSDGNYYVCDYKTNNKLKAQGELDEDRQLAMYSLWVKNNFKDCKKVKLIWYFLAFDKKMISERSEEQLQQLKIDTESLIKEVESCAEFPTNVTALCGWCVFKSICPALKHEFELQEKTPEEFQEDDGVKLVDAFSSLAEQKKQLEEDMERIREKLIEFSKQKEVTAVFGTGKKASVKSFETISLPPKAQRNKLNEIIFENDLWKDFSELDTHKLSKAIKENKLPSDLMKEIQSFITKKESYRISISKRKNGVES